LSIWIHNFQITLYQHFHPELFNVPVVNAIWRVLAGERLEAEDPRLARTIHAMDRLFADSGSVYGFLGFGSRCQFHQHFSYKCRFGSFFYVHVIREKLPKQCSYKKIVHKMLMKLTTGKHFCCSKISDFCKWGKGPTTFSISWMSRFEWTKQDSYFRVTFDHFWTKLKKNCLEPKTKSQAYPNPCCTSFSTAFLNKSLDCPTTELASLFEISFVIDSIFKVQINSDGIL